jgi:hypothetical protein
MNKILFIAFLLVTSLANAATFSPAPKTIDYELWVTSTGSNSNNCTASKPCATLARACTVATRFGTTIRIGAGTFNETALCILNIGVSIQGAGVGVTTLNSTYSSGDGYLIRAWSTVEGTLGYHKVSNLSMLGGLVGGGAISFKGRSNIIVDNVNIQNFANDGILFQGLKSDTPDSRQPTILATGIEITNSTIINSSSFLGGFGHGLIWVGGTDGMLIKNNVLTQIGRTAGTNGYNIKFANNGHNKNLKIHNNTITHTDATVFDFSIEIWHSLGCMEIYNNRIIGSVDLTMMARGENCGFAADIHKNIMGPNSYVSSGNQSIGFETYGDGVIVRNNIFQNNGAAISFYDNTKQVVFNDYKFFNNQFINVRQGFVYLGSNKDTVYSNFKVINNTLVGASGAVGLDGISIPGDAQAFNFEIRNNIVRDFSRGAVFSFNGNPLNTNARIENLSIEKNVFFNNGNSNLPNFLTVSIPVVPTNYINQNNLISDPLLVSLSDLHLQSGSPARAFGMLTEVQTDFNGFRRDTPVDAGAFQFTTLP